MCAHGGGQVRGHFKDRRAQRLCHVAVRGHASDYLLLVFLLLRY
jgi:hypothetical protein